MKIGSKGGSAPTALHDFVCGHHGLGHYGNRNHDARGITQSVIDHSQSLRHGRIVLTKSELLKRVEAAAASRADIARVLSLAPARITELYAGKRDLSFDEARTLIRHYRIQEPDEITSSLDEIVAEHGLAMIEEIDLSLGMGATYLNGDQPEVRGLVPFRAEWLRDIFAGSIHSLKVVRGSGDSMEPTIRNGDFVLIDTSKTRIDDQDVVWAVAYGDLGMIRRVRAVPGGAYLLMPDNPVVRPVEAHDGEMAVIGKVIWIGRRM